MLRSPRDQPLKGSGPHLAPQKPPPRVQEPPAELLRRLEFKVLRRLDGFLFGDYTGVFYGPSLDLAEVREYQPGDEVRRIDWSVTARTGKLHVRQYREEREITAWLIVDLSASMNFGTRRVLKREAALEFAVTAAAIVARHGDKVGAVVTSEGGMRILPAGTGRRQILKIAQLFTSPPSEAGPRNTSQPPPVDPLEQALHYLNRTLKRRALIFVVSDFLASPPAAPGALSWAKPIGRLAYRHEVIAVRISDPAERELPKVGELRLRDPESAQEIWVNTSDPRVRSAYAALVREHEEGIRRVLRSAQVDLLELSTAQEIVEPLLKFTLRRKGVRR
ncbi:MULTISPECIES: DUF58 domain-containing protein [unclassified Meiothermus]|uniref:DUF58 domain-containing protein n=1 Tax=unclassified Meiothermus TaxID=370471 RepID=UPI000D7C8C18|nr:MULTISPECIES: DUF58 domain-containing protein [unclassified Meiothermus]PZA07108.1 DUF58 domain-containing protein [Meiothermus sp. Pnk-1]RYM40009.1 DUF58 domain-containing protein [Meiothermus sp. PNK-Is4]